MSPQNLLQAVARNPEPANTISSIEILDCGLDSRIWNPRPTANGAGIEEPREFAVRGPRAEKVGSSGWPPSRTALRRPRARAESDEPKASGSKPDDMRWPFCTELSGVERRSKVPFRKRAARARLQVSLKANGTAFAWEFNRHNERPWPICRRVTRRTVIVPVQPFTQVARDSYVVPRRIALAPKNVHNPLLAVGHASRLAQCVPTPNPPSLRGGSLHGQETAYVEHAGDC